MMMKTKIRANGLGNITPFGYIRVKVAGKLYMQHRYVWEKTYGKIPDGLDVHHKNGVKTDNRLENLELLSREDHRRHHSGWKKLDNKWYKPCYDCKSLLEATSKNYYFTTKNNKAHNTPRLLFGVCRSCHVKRVCDARKIKKT